jgi:magnesium transporter
MPELQWPWAYPVLLGIMILITGLMLIFFKRKKWIGREKSRGKK